MSKPAAGAQPLHPFQQFNVNMLKYVGAKNGNKAFVSGQQSTVAASDTVVTGLSTVAACGATLESDPVAGCQWASAAIGDQAGAPAAGSILVKTWKSTAAGDTTAIAATTFTKKVNWWAIGTPVADRDDVASANVNI